MQKAIEDMKKQIEDYARYILELEAQLKQDKHHESVNHPSHYTHGEIECIDAIESALHWSGFVDYCRGNALKYVWRAGLKNDSAEDLLKAAWYCERAARTLNQKYD
jgi:hypothetical protein